MVDYMKDFKRWLHIATVATSPFDLFVQPPHEHAHLKEGVAATGAAGGAGGASGSDGGGNDGKDGGEGAGGDLESAMRESQSGGKVRDFTLDCVSVLLCARHKVTVGRKSL